MKKFLKYLYILMISISIIYPLNTLAEIKTVADDEDYVVSSEYTFTPRFIKDVTKVEQSSSGNPWIIYKNVGMWEQHTVDMKVALIDVIDTDPGTKCTNSAGQELNMLESYKVTLSTTGISILVDSNACGNAGAIGLFKIEFFDDATGDKLNDIKTC